AANPPSPGGGDAQGRRWVYRREAPDPLPAEPYFRKVRGSEAFLQAIAEEPLEDAHRLAFADWLEEHGHGPRAAFIRLQARRERLPEWHLLRRPLAEQSEALFEKHARVWTAGLPAHSKVYWKDGENFPLGLLDRVEVEAMLAPAGYERLFNA